MTTISNMFITDKQFQSYIEAVKNNPDEMEKDCAYIISHYPRRAYELDLVYLKSKDSTKTQAKYLDKTLFLIDDNGVYDVNDQVYVKADTLPWAILYKELKGSSPNRRELHNAIGMAYANMKRMMATEYYKVSGRDYPEREGEWFSNVVRKDFDAPVKCAPWPKHTWSWKPPKKGDDVNKQ
ncbi:hypothetical protein ACTOI6_18990 (plasmid) [Komagataeibacter intermedius]|uniref:hypothetical protein n=1 Tax=Komagataeibacter intermedius TaxID=66229 RepID=UPI0040351F5C